MGKVFHVTSLQFYMFSTEISLMQHFVNTVPVPISSMQQFFDETFLQCNISSTRYLFLQCNSSSMKHFVNTVPCTYFFNATVLLWNIYSMQHFVNMVPISSMQQFFYETFLQLGFRSRGIWLEPELSLWPGSTLNTFLIIHEKKHGT